MAQLKLFAAFRELAGTAELAVEAETVAAALHALGEFYGPEFARRLQTAAVAVNGVDCKMLEGHGTKLGPDDEIALLPPVSGGDLAATDQPWRLLAVPTFFWIFLLAASWLDVRAVAVIVAATAALSAMTASLGAGRPVRAVVATTSLLCLAFPFAALIGGQAGIFWTSAAAVAVLAAGLMLTAPPARAVAAMAHEVWLCLYFGFLGSYLVILARNVPGSRPLAALVAMVAVFMLVRTFTLRLWGGRFSGFPAFLSPGSLAAVAACEVAALGLGRVFLEFLSPVATAIMGVLIGFCILIGLEGAAVMQPASLDGHTARAAGGLQRKPSLLLPVRPALLEPFLLAAPAFYYAVVFYLT